MERWIGRTAGTLPGVGLIAALGAGCMSPTETAEPGELELVVEPLEASYDVVGHFHLTGLEAGTLDREILFDGTRSRESVALPAGHYALSLKPGASVLRADQERDVVSHAVLPATPHLVSAPPRLVTVVPGERLTARITLDTTLQSSAETTLSRR